MGLVRGYCDVYPGRESYLSQPLLILSVLEVRSTQLLPTCYHFSSWSSDHFPFSSLYICGVMGFIILKIAWRICMLHFDLTDHFCVMSSVAFACSFDLLFILFRGCDS